MQAIMQAHLVDHDAAHVDLLVDSPRPDERGVKLLCGCGVCGQRRVVCEQKGVMEWHEGGWWGGMRQVGGEGKGPVQAGYTRQGQEVNGRAYLGGWWS